MPDRNFSRQELRDMLEKLASKGSSVDTTRAASLAESLAGSAPPIDNKRKAHQFARNVMHGLRTPSGNRVAWDQVTVASRSRWPLELQVTRAILEYAWKTKISDYSSSAPRSHHRRIDLPGLLRDEHNEPTGAPSQSYRTASQTSPRAPTHHRRPQDDRRSRGRDRSRTRHRRAEDRKPESHGASRRPPSPLRRHLAAVPPARGHQRRLHSAPASSHRAVRESASPNSRVFSHTSSAVAAAQRERSRSRHRVSAASDPTDRRRHAGDALKRGLNLCRKYRSASRSIQQCSAVETDDHRLAVSPLSAQPPDELLDPTVDLPDSSRQLVLPLPAETPSPASAPWVAQLLASDDAIFLATLQHWTQTEDKLQSFVGGLQQAADEFYASGKTVFGASIDGLRHLVLKPFNPAELTAYMHNSGNMVRVFGEDAEALEKFVTACPRAVGAILKWAAGTTEPQSSRNVPNVLLPAPGRSAAETGQLHRVNEPNVATQPLQHVAQPPTIQQAATSIMRSAIVPFASQQSQSTSNAQSSSPVPAPCSLTAAIAGVTAALYIPKREQEQIQESDNADLRVSNPPIDPGTASATYRTLITKPRSPTGHPVMKFVCDEASPRLARWMFLRELALMEVFVLDVYAFSPSTIDQSMTATLNNGTAGVVSVKTKWGTVNWYREDGRLESPNGGEEMRRRLERVFLPWRPESDLGKYYKGKVPKQILNAFGPQVQKSTSFLWM